MTPESIPNPIKVAPVSDDVETSTVIIKMQGQSFGAEVKHSKEVNPKEVTITQMAAMVALSAIDKWMKEAMERAKAEDAS